MEKEYKLVPLSPETQALLRVLKAELGMTYDELVLSLINLYRSKP